MGVHTLVMRLLLLVRRGEFHRKLEGVPQVEANPVGQLFRRRIKRRHVAGLATLHVVRRAIDAADHTPRRQAQPAVGRSTEAAQLPAGSACHLSPALLPVPLSPMHAAA